MKNKFFIIAAIIIAVTAITIVSCKKDKTEESNTSSENIAKNDVPIESEDTDNMDEYLLSFKEKMQNATKGGETISLEQAQRDLGNLLNFDFGDANYPTNYIQHDTLFSKLLTMGDVVDLYQLQITYQSIHEQIIDTYEQIELPEKSIHYINCSFKRSGLDNEVVITTIMATRSMNNKRTNILDWRAGSGAGSCDGLLVDWWGAPEEITGMLNSNLGIPVCENGVRVYFTDEDQNYKSALHDDMVDNNSPCGRRLLFLVSSNPFAQLKNTCIVHEELMYYYNQARNLPTTHRSTFYPNPIPTNHVVIEYKLYSLRSPASEVGTSLWWNLLVTHAKPHCTGTLPDV